MSAKSYTKKYFGINVLFSPLGQHKNLYISSERVLNSLWERRSRDRVRTNVENILNQTLYEVEIILLPPVVILGDFYFYILVNCHHGYSILPAFD